jgi:hypothetical protein
MRGCSFPLTVAAAAVLATPGNAVLDPAAAPSSGVTIPPLYKNCTNLNKRYPHGLGKRLARDHTSGTPVRTFYRSTRLYNVAMSHNRGLDRDKDGIACEKR